MPIQRMYRFVVSALVALAFCTTSGCSTDAKTAKSAEVATQQGTHSDSAGGLVVAPRTPYLPRSHSGPAALVITVSPDSLAAPKANEGTCEVAPAKPASVSDAVLWVDGIRQGKPITQERRYQLVSAGCALSPRIQGVVVGGAVNVFNDDIVLHTLVFIRAGTNDTLQTMPFTNGAELVASDRLTKTPGIIEVRCAQHPQERAYIAVFDHPYFGVAAHGEKVLLDSVPPGDYQVLSWREGMAAPTAVASKVGSSGQTQVIVK
jgi:hypothetical protein